MANKKYDGVIEAVHYKPDGQIDWVRAYLRRGATWSDRIIMTRKDLIDTIKSGIKMAIGQRVDKMGGTFDFSVPVQVTGRDGSEVLTTSSAPGDHDRLDGAPVL